MTTPTDLHRAPDEPEDNPAQARTVPNNKGGHDFINADGTPFRSMVEVLARAICRERFDDSGTGDDGWNSAPPELRDDYMREARSCLQALLDHAEDEEMLKAGELAVSRLWEPADSTVAYAAFRAMISKALGK